MRGKALAYALAASVGAHIAILCVVGKSYSASPQVPKLEVEPTAIRVNVEMPRSEQRRPRPVVAPRQDLIPESQRIPPPAPKASLTARIFGPKPAPVPQPQTPPVQSPVYSTKPARVASSKLPGNPGGALNLGSGSSRGENLGNSGRTPTGWVPGSPNGTGQGSGSGPGVGKPEPVPSAVEGPGRDPAPPPPPPPPDVDMRVCSESRMLPGPNCESMGMRSFRPGSQPTSTCIVCKPKHVSTLADRSVPDMISGRRAPKYPESARDKGIEGTVSVEYTINTDGNVVGVSVSSSSGSSQLDGAAMDTVRGRKYHPAVQGGIPRNYRKRETFHFALD